MAPHEPPEWLNARVTPEEHDRVIGGSYRAQAEDHGPPAKPAPPPPPPWPLRKYLPAMAWALGAAALTGATFGAVSVMADGAAKGALFAVGLVLMLLCIAGSLFLAGEAS